MVPPAATSSATETWGITILWPRRALAAVHDLGLDIIGIAPDKKGVPVDEDCRVADGVWAVGDVTGVALFPHVDQLPGTGGRRQHSRPSRACASYLGIARLCSPTPRSPPWAQRCAGPQPGGHDVATTTARLADAHRPALDLRTRPPG